MATGPRKMADAIVASMAEQRRPQQQGAVWRESDPGRSRRVLPQFTRGRRELVPPPAYCGTRSKPCRAGLVPFCRHGFLPQSLTWPRVFAACLPCRARLLEAYSYACRVVPFYCR